MILFPVTTTHLYNLQARRFVHMPDVSFTGQTSRSQARRFVYMTGVSFTGQTFRARDMGMNRAAD